MHEQLAVENSFSTYVCYASDGLFWLNLYYRSPIEIFLTGIVCKFLLQNYHSALVGFSLKNIHLHWTASCQKVGYFNAMKYFEFILEKPTVSEKQEGCF